MFNESEVFVYCPYCVRQISFLLEELFGNQSYIEDCQVCCQPIQLSYRVEDGQIVDLMVSKDND